jgi:hypothetical protein
MEAFAVYCCGELDIIEYSMEAAKLHAASLRKHLGFDASEITIKRFANEAAVKETI